MKKICKKCKLFVEGTNCPVCKSNQFADSFKGKIIITDAEKSEIAEKLEIKVKGEYAIKIWNQ